MVFLNGKFNTYMHFNIEQELNIAFLEVLHTLFVLYTGKRRAARASRHRGNGGGSATLHLPFGLDSTTAPGVGARSAAGSF